MSYTYFINFYFRKKKPLCCVCTLISSVLFQNYGLMTDALDVLQTFPRTEIHSQIPWNPPGLPNTCRNGVPFVDRRHILGIPDDYNPQIPTDSITMVSMEFHYVRVLGIRYNLETGGNGCIEFTIRLFVAISFYFKIEIPQQKIYAVSMELIYLRTEKGS